MTATMIVAGIPALFFLATIIQERIAIEAIKESCLETASTWMTQ